MQYHIQTAPIIDAFKSDCECPLCKLYEIMSARIVNQYLNEAVMEPDYRVRVNKLGFCSEHLRALFKGENKLGLALQLNTRTLTVLEKLKDVKDVKAAKKQSQILKDTQNTCVICESVDEVMTRYAYTVAQMYLNETFFPQLLKDSKGFCLPHYTLLLDNAHKAGNKVSEYLSELSSLQIKNMQRINNDTERFTNMFDYNSGDKGQKGSGETVPRAINKLKGNIV